MEYVQGSLADILKFPRKQPNLEHVSSSSGVASASQADVRSIEDLECGPWTTRKLKIPTSLTGCLIIECFESADGKRLKGFGKMEPNFCLSNLKIQVQSAFSFDELTLFPYNGVAYAETDFMSHVVNYPERGGLIVILSLSLCERIVQCKLWF